MQTRKNRKRVKVNGKFWREWKQKRLLMQPFCVTRLGLEPKTPTLKV